MNYYLFVRLLKLFVHRVLKQKNKTLRLRPAVIPNIKIYTFIIIHHVVLKTGLFIYLFCPCNHVDILVWVLKQLSFKFGEFSMRCWYFSWFDFWGNLIICIQCNYSHNIIFSLVVFSGTSSRRYCLQARLQEGLKHNPGVFSALIIQLPLELIMHV